MEGHVEELIFIGRSDDNTSLIFVTEEGQEFVAQIDEHLVRDVTSRPSKNDSSDHLNDAPGVSPREIQSRIRRGESVAEIAADAQVDESRIERYAGPVLSERAYMASKARETFIRRNTEDETLETAVHRQLDGISVDTLGLDWDSYRREDARWNVSVKWSIGAGDGVANWIFDPMSQTVLAIDDEARWLLEEDVDVPQQSEPERPRLVGLPATDSNIRPASVSLHTVPSVSRDENEYSQVDPRTDDIYDDHDDANAQDFVFDADEDFVEHDSKSANDSGIDVPAWAGPGQPTMPVPAPLRTATQPPVDDSPSWDDILFGHRPAE